MSTTLFKRPALVGLAGILALMSFVPTAEAQYRRPTYYGRRRGGWRNVYLAAIIVVSRGRAAVLLVTLGTDPRLHRSPAAHRNLRRHPTLLVLGLPQDSRATSSTSRRGVAIAQLVGHLPADWRLLGIEPVRWRVRC